MTKVTDTSKQLEENLFGMMALGSGFIEVQEAQGQQEFVHSQQLPAKLNSYSKECDVKEIYEKMGIKIIDTPQTDKLFINVILPDGWKLKLTDHSMWNELVDEKNRVRAMIFYKAAFYDRDAFINLERRFNYSYVSWLPSEEKGHYEIVKAKQRVKPDYTYRDLMKNDEMYIQPIYETVEEKVWVPKYKDEYEEYNNTPHYIEVTDGRNIIFSTKDNPEFFKMKYTKKNHANWWEKYDKFEQAMRKKAIDYLNENYPGWDDKFAYWD